MNAPRYLMRANPGRFNAQRAKDLCVERRPVVCPNDGFWRTLCSLEATLGITDRCGQGMLSCAWVCGRAGLLDTGCRFIVAVCLMHLFLGALMHIGNSW